MKRTKSRKTLIVLVIEETQDQASSSFPAAPPIDTTAETVMDTFRPLAKCRTVVTKRVRAWKVM